ncbi:MULTISPECIES: GspH/FimT family pseudopilin [Pseudoalteromonas]|uniref:Type II secretion system protein H n=1 Tax=Pseudoalteromonas viridis TaxID=339617 RepID=A0ABX7V7E1_9GAMM|nr:MULTISPECIES: GspH/FimT family pseudopilin [Pseudoalteromonas]QTL35362.1 GspH/FimT family pseudopilin [Pseudoalteromonas viridis]
MDSRTIRGFSLLELIICLALFSVLLLLAAPAVHSMTELDRAKQALVLVDRHLTLARLHAITHQTPVTICPLVNNRCTNFWHQELTIFTDRDERAYFDKNDAKLMVLSEIRASDTLDYPRAAITFKHTGTLKGFGNGTFVYCTQRLTGAPLGLALSVSVVGRSRLRDTNKCI